jgi:anion transporter
LLVSEKSLHRLKINNNFIIGETELEQPVYSTSKIVLSLGIISTMIGLASFNIISISIATLGGVVAMVATEVVKPPEIYKCINWEIFFLLAGLIPLGVAIEQTGTAKYIASQLLKVTGNFPPIVILGILYYFTCLLTDIISNNASVLLMIPIAVGAANQLGANPFAFVLTVTFASSAAFATPIGYQTNLMVYGPGGYKFRDYIKVGVPLEILLAFVVPIFVTIFWGL